jgi:GNAT superfamily N-acetyltransferase
VSERFRWLREEVDGDWLLLKQVEEIVGWGVVVWSGKKTHLDYPDIQDMFTKPEHRSKGLGTFLIKYIEKLAKSRGFKRIGLAVNPDDNVLARKLYERLGYRHDGGVKYLDGVYDGYEDWVIDLEKAL